MKNDERVGKSANSDAESVYSDTNTANGKKKGETNGVAGPVHYESTTDRVSQRQQNVRNRRIRTTASKADWLKEVAISAEY